jgi:YD repeat-containing protein
LADGSRYNFEYNSYAQVYLVRHYAFDNHQRSYTSYTLPASSTDCPRVSESHEWAENWNSDQEATTTYTLALDHSSGQATMPDTTTSYKELFATTGWSKGLTTGTEFWSGGVKKKWTTTAYTQDDINLPYQKNPRVIETNIYDLELNRKRMTIDYGSGSGTGSGQYAQYGLPYVVTEYAADGATPLRYTYTDYNLDPAYVNNRIIGLVSTVHVSDSAWQSKTVYAYDAGGDQLQATQTAATQHDATYSTGLTARGNVTSVSRYNVEGANITNDSLALTTRIGYDTDGSVIFSRDPLNHQTSISYADSFSDGNHAFNTFAYPTKVTPSLETGENAENFSSSTQYNYYFGAVTRMQGPVPAGQTAGPIQTMQYDAAGRISRVDNLSNGAWKYWVYPDRQDAVQTLTAINSDTPSYYQITVVDGNGRLRAQGGDLPNVAGRYWGAFTYYDVMGRASQTSNLAEITSAWSPTGEDAAGWIWTLQAYDWKGRPTVTTNLDGTTKEASYGGCGCAGGEVVTLRDEVGRQQRVTSDVLGRTWKTEVLDWNGNVYSTLTNNYNARDQITSTVEQGVSGTSQITTLTYDGYGRVKEQQAPSQTATTKYAYNEDDTVKNVTDGRGIITIFGYNNRHQVTGISYSQQTGIAQTPSITFSYDAAGNRTSMTDGSGSVTYQYDQLSRLTSETRQFTGLTGSYPLSYSYNLGGELTSITDPTGAVVNYSYDPTGRMTNITGSTFAGITQYATNMQYRAWGAVKSASYGDSTTLSANYNSRLLPTDFSISNTLTKHYEYNADGRLRYSKNNTGDRFDRSYTYDHVGRVIEAASGPKARGEADSDFRPYDLSYEYDEMNHLTSRGGRLWSGQAPSEESSYSNDRNISWQYDVDGRLTSSGETQYTYDAAGRDINVVGQGGDLTQTQVFDGDGARTMLSSQQVTPTENGTTTETKTQYFVTSSVLGRVVTELDQSGAKTRTFVYQGSQILAWQQQNGTTRTMAWEHRDVSNASIRGGAAAELDPLGMNAGLINPFLSHSTRPALQEARTYPGFADMMSGSQCRVDGIDYPCSMINSEATLQCPDNDCGPRRLDVTNPDGEHRSILTLPFMAFANGVSGFFLPGWAQMGTPQEQADIVLAAINGVNQTGMDSSHRQGQGQFANNFLPQNTWRDLSRDEISKEMDNALNFLDKHPDCEKWLNKLLEELKNSTGLGAGSIRDIVERFRKDGIAVTDGATNGTGTGAVGTKNGRLEIGFQYGGTKEETAEMLLHEMIHWAKFDHYPDEAMAKAWNKLGKAISLEEFNNLHKDYITTTRQKYGMWLDSWAYSEIAGGTQSGLCFGKKNGVMR